MALTIAASAVVSVVALALAAGAAPGVIQDVPLLGELMSHRGWVGPSDVARNAPLPGAHDKEEPPADADPEAADPDRRRATDADAQAGGAGPRTPAREDRVRPPAAGPVEPGRPVEPGSTPPQSTPEPEDPATPPPAAQEPGRGPIGAYLGCTPGNPDPRCQGRPGKGDHTPSTKPDPDPDPDKPSTKSAPPKPSSSKPPSEKPEPSKPEPSTKPGKESDKNDGDGEGKKDHDKGGKKDDSKPAGDAGEHAD